jgi:hypothetical protein
MQITIPASVEKIGGRVFSGSGNLAAVYGKGISKKPAGWPKSWNQVGYKRRAKAYWNQ